MSLRIYTIDLKQIYMESNLYANHIYCKNMHQFYHTHCIRVPRFRWRPKLSYDQTSQTKMISDQAFQTKMPSDLCPDYTALMVGQI